MSFNQFILREQYLKVKGLGDRLELMKEQIDWKPFVPLVRKVFFDDKEQGGRPHTNELVVVRALLLQGWYGLSDPELEFQINDRLSFRNFLGFPETVPDFSTVWKIRERLQKEGIDKKIWNELQRLLAEKGYEVKKGVIQDASFVEADLGRKRHYQEKKAEKEGRVINYNERQKSHIDRDGTFSVKHGQVHYGYKAHVKIDVDHGLIRAVETSTASLHDSQVNLVKKADKAALILLLDRSSIYAANALFRKSYQASEVFFSLLELWFGEAFFRKTYNGVQYSYFREHLFHGRSPNHS